MVEWVNEWMNEQLNEQVRIKCNRIIQLDEVWFIVSPDHPEYRPSLFTAQEDFPMSAQTAARVMLALDCIPLSITTKLPQHCQVAKVSATNKRGHSDQNWIWSASTVFLYNEDPWRYQQSHNENPLGTLVDGGDGPKRVKDAIT